MAKKLALTTLFLALVAFATATRRTTVVTTTTFYNEGDTNPQQQCQSSQQYQGKQFMNSCIKVIGVVIPRTQGDEPLLIEMVNGEHSSDSAAKQAAERLAECCGMLGQLENECRCEAINDVARQAILEVDEYRQQGPQQKDLEEHYEGLKRVVRNRAAFLPEQCNFRKPCQIRSILF